MISEVSQIELISIGITLKYRAHIGDSLASFFARTLMMDLVVGGVLQKERYFVHCNRMTSNEHFTRTAEKFSLFGDVGSFKYYDQRAIGTRYEARIYDLYVEMGMDTAFNFFKTTAYDLYLQKNESEFSDVLKMVK